jgi:hypothetical protein
MLEFWVLPLLILLTVAQNIPASATVTNEAIPTNEAITDSGIVSQPTVIPSSDPSIDSLAASLASGLVDEPFNPLNTLTSLPISASNSQQLPSSTSLGSITPTTTDSSSPLAVIPIPTGSGSGNAPPDGITPPGGIAPPGGITPPDGNKPSNGNNPPGGNTSPGSPTSPPTESTATTSSASESSTTSETSTPIVVCSYGGIPTQTQTKPDVGPTSCPLAKRTVFLPENFPDNSVQDFYVDQRDEAIANGNVLENRGTPAAGGLTSSRTLPFSNTPFQFWVSGQKGCTTVFVFSKHGMWAAHFWEQAFARFIFNSLGEITSAVENDPVQQIKFNSDVLGFMSNGDGPRKNTI